LYHTFRISQAALAMFFADHNPHSSLLCRCSATQLDPLKPPQRTTNLLQQGIQALMVHVGCVRGRQMENLGHQS
jgi:hypothetical protein